MPDKKNFAKKLVLTAFLLSGVFVAASAQRFSVEFTEILEYFFEEFDDEHDRYILQYDDEDYYSSDEYSPQNEVSAETDTHETAEETITFDIVFPFPDGPPQYLNGINALRQRFKDEFSKEIAQKYLLQSQVVVAFLIDFDGTVRNVSIRQGINDAVNNEVLRIALRTGEWFPAIQNGVPILANFLLPITFDWQQYDDWEYWGDSYR